MSTPYYIRDRFKGNRNYPFDPIKEKDYWRWIYKNNKKSMDTLKRKYEKTHFSDPHEIIKDLYISICEYEWSLWLYLMALDRTDLRREYKRKERKKIETIIEELHEYTRPEWYDRVHKIVKHYMETAKWPKNMVDYIFTS